MPTTPYFYAANPQAVVAATPTPDGVEISITHFQPSGATQSVCVMSCDEFARLATAGDAIITATRTAHNNEPA